MSTLHTLDANTPFDFRKVFISKMAAHEAVFFFSGLELVYERLNVLPMVAACWAVRSAWKS
jgi:hypothetical protein